MPERRGMLFINEITDDDTGMYEIGEIDGIFDRVDLRQYMNKYGKKGKDNLITHLAYLNYQVMEAWINYQEMHAHEQGESAVMYKSKK